MIILEPKTFSSVGNNIGPGERMYVLGGFIEHFNEGRSICASLISIIFLPMSTNLLIPHKFKGHYG